MSFELGAYLCASNFVCVSGLVLVSLGAAAGTAGADALLVCAFASAFASVSLVLGAGRADI